MHLLVIFRDDMAQHFDCEHIVGLGQSAINLSNFPVNTSFKVTLKNGNNVKVGTSTVVRSSCYI